MLFWILILLFVPALINAISHVISDQKKRERANKGWKQLQERENKKFK